MPLRFELTVQTRSMYRYHQPSPIFPCTIMISWKSVPRTKQRAIMTGERISNSSSCIKQYSLKICENCPTNHLKAEKIGVKEAISSLFAILCFLPLPQIWSYEFLLSTGTGEGTNMFNGPANLKRFHLKKRDQSSSKDPHFLYRNYNVLK